MTPINSNLNSPAVKMIKLLFYSGVIALPLVILMWYWGYLDPGKSTSYLFYFFSIIVLFLYIKRDALLIFIFLSICIIIFYIECFITPFFIFSKLTPEVFKSYWKLFSFAYFGIVLHHIFLVKPGEVKKSFVNRQKYLQLGVVNISFGGQFAKLSIYDGNFLLKFIKIACDLFLVSIVTFVMVQGIISIYGKVPLSTLKIYIGSCFSLILAIILARAFAMIFFALFFLFSAKKKKQTRFVFASDV